MLRLTVKLFVALVCFTAVYLSTEAADTCRATTTSCIPGLPGRDGQPGRDDVTGPPGRDGRDGLPGNSCTASGALKYTEQQQLKEEILATIREEISMLSCCNATQPTPDPGPQCEGTFKDNPQAASSCKAIYECNPTAPSGYYWIRNATGSTVQVFCLMNTTNCGNITGGWMRAAYIDMTDPGKTCPENLTYTVQSSTRMCRSSHTSAGCTSVTFPTHMTSYTKVCGRARGYQYASPDSFLHTRQGQTSIEGYYVDGLSVTHGRPRNHIWTFAAGVSKDYNYGFSVCPCAAPNPGADAPPFVGEQFFCESGNTGRYSPQWYLDDPLWDSQGCASGSTCCSRGGPWFSSAMSKATSDDIEVRWCSSSDIEDTGVDQLEIYVN